jgi:hypothetical protein
VEAKHQFVPESKEPTNKYRWLLGSKAFHTVGNLGMIRKTGKSSYAFVAKTPFGPWNTPEAIKKAYAAV